MKPRQVSPSLSRVGLSARLGGNENGILDLSSQLDTDGLLSPPRSLLGNKLSLPNRRRLKMVMLGGSVTFSQAESQVPYRGLLRELSARGHDVLFLERDPARTSSNNGSLKPAVGRTEGYSALKELKDRFVGEIREADCVIVSSDISEGIKIGEWVTRTAQGATAFYDLNASQTLANLAKGDVDYISASLIPRYHLYLSLTGGPVLDHVEKQYGSPMARPLYCAVDAMLFFPDQQNIKWDLGYVGNYSQECQPTLNRLLIEPARRWEDGCFAVAGAGYPRSPRWPKNVKRVPQLSPGRRRAFYNSQRFALNVTPPSAIAVGFSPNVRLLEAAACGTPVITEFWPGQETVFKSDDEILISHSRDETLIYLEEISELERRRIGYRSRERVLARHTTRHRVTELENYVLEVLKTSTT